MRTHFVEVSNGFNWGKFMLARLTPEEGETRSALPGYERYSLFQGRKFVPGMVLVVDLQTAEGAAFDLKGSASADLDKHRVWVCPMFEPFLEWLYAHYREHGHLLLDSVPRYLELTDAEPAMVGYRRDGPDD